MGCARWWEHLAAKLLLADHIWCLTLPVSMSTPISAKYLFLCSLTKFGFSHFVAEFDVYFSLSLIYQPFNSAHGYARNVYMLLFRITVGLYRCYVFLEDWAYYIGEAIQERIRMDMLHGFFLSFFHVQDRRAIGKQVPFFVSFRGRGSKSPSLIKKMKMLFSQSCCERSCMVYVTWLYPWGVTSVNTHKLVLYIGSWTWRPPIL
jgi:hypothetical protein